MDLHRIKNDIMKLGLKDRAALARWLLQSLDELSESEIQELWVAESEQRLDEMDRSVVP